MSFWPILRLPLIALALLAAFEQAPTQKGRVVDPGGRGIAAAIVTSGDRSVVADAEGNFTMEADGGGIGARAPGYRAVRVKAVQQDMALIRLAPFTPRALYLSYYGIGSKTLREAALDLIHKSDRLNALVIDVKGDRGLIAFKTGIALAHEIGADRTATIPEVSALLKELHDSGIYAIARIVVFKDEPLGSARPDLAVKTTTGSLFHDSENLAWTDPFRSDVRDYNIGIAVEAARAGFDEIQFDYLRFPDAPNLRFSEPNTMQSRTKAIDGFLAEARRRLTPYNVFLAADVFGYVCWNTDDTGIGQKLEDILPLVDYVSPMLYPSGFTFGIPGYRDPVQHPYEIVRNSLERARMRTGVSPARFRPWLQAFRDYAFDRRVFDANEMEPQLIAAEDFGAAGWMIWNPRNVYSDMGL